MADWYDAPVGTRVGPRSTPVEDPTAGDLVAVRFPNGSSGTVPRSQLEHAVVKQGAVLEDAGSTAARADAKKYEGRGFETFARSVAGAGTFGGTDLLARLVAPEYAKETGKLEKHNEAANIAGAVVGSVTGGAAKLATGAGKLVAGTIKGTGLASRVGRTGAAMATEGALFGAGQGLSAAALSDDPLTAERAVSSIASGALFGAAVGGGLGVGGKLLAEGAGAAKAAAGRAASRFAGGADDAARSAQAADDFADLAKFDRKGLQAAAKTEREAITTAHKAARVEARAAMEVETEAIKASARKEAATVLDEARAFAKESRNSFVNAEDASIGARLGKTKLQVMKTLDDPEGWIKNPFQAEATAKALRVQKQALNEALKSGALTPNGMGTAEAWLARNQALQARIEGFTTTLRTPKSAKLDELTEALAAEAPRTSARLEAIEARIVDKTPVQKMAGAVMGGAAAGAAYSAGLGLLSPVAYALGKQAGEAVAERSLGKLVGRVAKSVAEKQGSITGAVDSFFSGAGKVAKAARPTVTRVLTEVSYASPERVKAMQPAQAVATSKNPRVGLYRAREAELRAVTAPDMTGKPTMRMDARTELNERLGGIWATAPQLADQMEALAARRVEFLADKLPKRPGSPTLAMGPDRWQPSEMAMAKFARYADAVEHPENVIERMGNGTMTPEDAEALREVYPEIYQDVRMEIFARLPELQATLPYQQRLMLSIFFDAPVDAAMDPVVVQALQATFATEANTEGGTQAPSARFASLKAPQVEPSPTSAQRRAG